MRKVQKGIFSILQLEYVFFVRLSIYTFRYNVYTNAYMRKCMKSLFNPHSTNDECELQSGKETGQRSHSW